MCFYSFHVSARRFRYESNTKHDPSPPGGKHINVCPCIRHIFIYNAVYLAVPTWRTERRCCFDAILVRFLFAAWMRVAWPCACIYRITGHVLVLGSSLTVIWDSQAYHHVLVTRVSYTCQIMSAMFPTETKISTLIHRIR